MELREREGKELRKSRFRFFFFFFLSLVGILVGMLRWAFWEVFVQNFGKCLSNHLFCTLYIIIFFQCTEQFISYYLYLLYIYFHFNCPLLII